MEKSGKSQNQHVYWCHLIYELYDDNEQTLTLFHDLREGMSQQAQAGAKNASIPIRKTVAMMLQFVHNPWRYSTSP